MGLFSGVVGAIGGLIGGKKEAEGYMSAQEELNKLGPVAEDIRDRLDAEGNRTRKRTSDAGEDVYGRLTGIGETLYGDTAYTRGFQDNIVGQLKTALSGNIEGTAGYNFVRDEALEATRREASAGGYRGSGRMFTELQDRASGLASKEYHNIIGNLSNILGTVGNINQSAANTYAGLATSAGGIYSDLFSTGEKLSAGMLQTGEQLFSSLKETQHTGAADAQIGRGEARAGGVGSAIGSIASIF